MGVPASCHGENSRDFSVEVGRGIETELVARKGQSALCWEKLLEVAPWVVACDLKQGAVSQCEAVERALDSGSWVLGSFRPQQSVISPTK